MRAAGIGSRRLNPYSLCCMLYGRRSVFVGSAQASDHKPTKERAERKWQQPPNFLETEELGKK
jgi:hypothetical protein